MIYFQRYFQNQEFGKFGLSYSNEVLLERLLVPTRVSLKIKKAQIFSKFVQGFKGWVFVGLDRIQRIEDRVEDRNLRRIPLFDNFLANYNSCKIKVPQIFNIR